ncbi:MAG: pyrroline-5-carboxylate reductase [Alteromonadaceae bacterium]|jgi:pyrroline-5-carboxylate reductase|tara:strand:- start:13802 stop:14620 length:819 start_codon:yes stop_codon:yes gene_type:complete
MKKVAFIGAGNMNASIINGLIKQGVDAQSIIVSNPSAEKRLALANSLGIKQTASNVDAARFADLIVLGVKPHFINDVCQEISQTVDIKAKCFLSVAVGCTIAQMEKALGESTAIIRTMPNTPSQLGLGMTGMFASPSVNKEQHDYADYLMAAAGETVWLDKEEQIDDIASISGSGPAYFFLFMEAMQQQAKAAGFSEAVSRQLVQQTALGAANMVVYNPELEISELRNNVTSKGGTTQAALTTFIDGGLTALVSRAMKAALNRAQAIAKQNS